MRAKVIGLLAGINPVKTIENAFFNKWSSHLRIPQKLPQNFVNFTLGENERDKEGCVQHLIQTQCKPCHRKSKPICRSLCLIQTFGAKLMKIKNKRGVIDLHLKIRQFPAIQSAEELLI